MLAGVAVNTTLRVASKIPDGTSVSTYLAAGWPPGQAMDGNAPVGSAQGSTGAVSGGLVTVTGLAPNTEYVVGGQVSGVYKYVRFSTPPGSTLDVSDAAANAKRAFANVATGTTDGPVVAAVPGKQIRVVACVLSCGATATGATFTTKPAGAGSAISPLFSNGANGGVAMNYNPAGWLQTNVGEGLSLTTTAAGSSTGVLVDYLEV